MSAVICVIGNRKLSPLEAAPAHSTGHPEGGRHGCRPFSDQAMDGLSENGDDTTRALSDFDFTRKVLSFGYFSLLATTWLALRAGSAVRAFGAVHQQRKVTRRKAKAFDLPSVSEQDQTRFALAGEVLSFAGPKESTQRKRPSPTDRSRSVRCRRHFRTRHPWLGPKTAAIHGGRPTGVRVQRRLLVYGKSRSRAAGTA